MVVGKETLKRWFNECGNPYWKLHGHTGMLMQEYDPHGADQPTLTDSLDKLDMTLDMLAPGSYSITAWATKDQKRDRVNMRFEIPHGNGTNSRTPAVNGLPPADLDAKIAQGVAAGIAAYKSQCELDELKKKNAELEKKIKEAEPDAIGRIAERAWPFLEIWLSSKAGAPVKAVAPAIAGPKKEEEPATEEEHKRMEAALEKIHARDPDNFLKNIEGIAGLDDGKWNMAKRFL
jgi:hypothetical protein